MAFRLKIHPLLAYLPLFCTYILTGVPGTSPENTVSILLHFLEKSSSSLSRVFEKKMKKSILFR